MKECLLQFHEVLLGYIEVLSDNRSQAAPPPPEAA